MRRDLESSAAVAVPNCTSMLSALVKLYLRQVTDAIPSESSAEWMDPRKSRLQDLLAAGPESFAWKILSDFTV